MLVALSPNKDRDEDHGHLVEQKAIPRFAQDDGRASEVIGVFDDVDPLFGEEFAARLANLKTASEQ